MGFVGGLLQRILILDQKLDELKKLEKTLSYDKLKPIRFRIFKNH